MSDRPDCQHVIGTRLLGPRKRDPFRWCGVCKEACEGGDLCKGCAENADLSTASNQSDKMGRSCVSAVVTTVPAPASSPIGPLMTDDLRTRIRDLMLDWDLPDTDRSEIADAILAALKPFIAAEIRAWADKAFTDRIIHTSVPADAIASRICDHIGQQ